MRFGGENERRHVGEFSYAWLSHDNADQFAPAIDPATGVQVIVGGRLAWSRSQWQRAERLPYKGGLACRLILERYLEHGDRAVVPYNGAAALLVWDPRSRSAHLWTDQFGYHPAFLYGKDPACPNAFTTFPDAIRYDPERDATEDETSMVEFLSAWRATPPNTYYKYLKHAGAATHWRWELESGKVASEEYWHPFRSDFFRRPQEAAEALSAALRTAVAERTAAAKRVALFISGGADSRVMLFGADDPSKITGINLYETEPTMESQVAKELCDRVGARFIGFPRDNDYYPRMLPEIVRWSGAMWSVEDSHYLGVKHLVDEVDADLVMTACTTDWVFKGYGLEKRYRRVAGKNLPLKRFLKTRVDGFLPNYPRSVPEEFRDRTAERLQAWFRGCPRELQNDLDYLRVEDRRVRPACYTVSVSGQIMYRTFPYDTFLADSRVADCYARIPAKMKLNSDVWGLAASNVCMGADDIVDANYGWAIDSSPMRKLTNFAAGWVRRRMPGPRQKPDNTAPKDAHPPCYASWPDLGWYANHSPTVKRVWNNAALTDRERLTRLWGIDPWATPLEQWAESPLDFFRILTLLEHLSADRDTQRKSSVPAASGTPGNL